MASPVVAGTAALIMSYFPELTALEVKDIIRQSSRKFDQLKISKPGQDSMIEFGELSSTGGVINALSAIQLAQEVVKKKLTK